MSPEAICWRHSQLEYMPKVAYENWRVQYWVGFRGFMMWPILIRSCAGGNARYQPWFLLYRDVFVQWQTSGARSFASFFRDRERGELCAGSQSSSLVSPAFPSCVSEHYFIVWEEYKQHYPGVFPTLPTSFLPLLPPDISYCGQSSFLPSNPSHPPDHRLLKLTSLRICLVYPLTDTRHHHWQLFSLLHRVWEKQVQIIHQRYLFYFP